MEVEERSATAIEYAATPLDESGAGSDLCQEGLEPVEGLGSSVLHGPVHMFKEELRCRTPLALVIFASPSLPWG